MRRGEGRTVHKIAHQFYEFVKLEITGICRELKQVPDFFCQILGFSRLLILAKPPGCVKLKG